MRTNHEINENLLCIEILIILAAVAPYIVVVLNL